MRLTLAGPPAAANDGAIAYDGLIMMFSRMTSAGVVAAGLIAGAALCAAPAGADPVTPPAKQPAAAAEVTLNDEEKRLAKAMNVSEADMLATKKAHLAA